VGEQNECANGNKAESRLARFPSCGADLPGVDSHGSGLDGFGFVVARFGLYLQPKSPSTLPQFSLTGCRSGSAPR
jgi:hypothetical protein